MDGSEHWVLQPIVTAMAIVVAIAAIAWNRRMTRLKATLDLIESAESKEYYQVRYQAFREFRRGSAFRDGVLDPKGDPENQLNRDQCLDFLNHYELVAVACRKGIIDAEFYRLWMGPAFVRDWNCAADLVRAARVPRRPGDAGSSTAYCAFERLAIRWGGTRIL